MGRNNMSMAITSANIQYLQAANAQIMLNAGIPTADGKTTAWASPKLAYNQTFYYIPAPDAGGWNGVTYNQMMQNVLNANVSLVTFGNTWIAPIPT
jgi:hypothetical protein